jgi:hypothetical protein
MKMKYFKGKTIKHTKNVEERIKEVQKYLEGAE